MDLFNYRRSMIFLSYHNLAMLYVFYSFETIYLSVAPQYTVGSSSLVILYNRTDPQNLHSDRILHNFLQELCNETSANFRGKILCYFAALIGW